MMSLSSALFSLLFLLLQPRPSRLYSLHNCSFELTTPWEIYCSSLSRFPSDIPNSTVSLVIIDITSATIQRSDFRRIKGLRSLELSNSQVSHIEDAAFSDLSALTELSLNSNRLKYLTEKTFEGLSNLNSLDLGLNQIESVSERTFRCLKNLQTLSLKGNSLSQSSDIVNVFTSCPLLQTLDLSDNSFTSFESQHFLSPLNVSELDFQGNPLRTFTLHSDLFPRLETLRLSNINAQFQWNVASKFFLRNVRTLDLRWTNFTTETYQSVFQSVSSVETLDLSSISGLLDRHLLDFVCAIPSLQELLLRDNSLSLKDNRFLQSCTGLINLDLSYNSLTNLTESSLQMLTRLSKLDLSLNHLTRVPLTIRNMSSLTSISFDFNQISRLGCLDFTGLWRLTKLSLSNNHLSELISCAFQDLHNLKWLYLDNNFIVRVEDSFSAMVPNLQLLNADNNNIAVLQKGVFRNMSRLKTLGLESKRETLMKEGALDGLLDLQYLSCSSEFGSNKGSNSSTGGRSQVQQISLPSLQTFILTVSLEKCLLYSPDLLRGLNGLKEFSSFHLFCKPPPKEMFLHTPLLQKLYIYINDNLRLDSEVFHPIPHLQHLYLPSNHLQSVDFLSQANLTKLEELVLSYNQLVVVNQDVFEALPSLRFLDLSYNPFVCNCSNAGFIQWARANKQVYVHDAFRYRCASPQSEKGRLLLDFDVQSCWDFPGQIYFIFSSVLVLLTLLSTFTYHFLRWHLLYGFYLLRAFVYNSRKSREGCAEVYDAFVSYNVHDEDWVYRELVPELEDRQGWRLCLHHRDFEPGRAIMENITDAIYSSRKTLCVISRQYLLSEWCSREIQMASFRLLDEQKDVLILLLLEELPAAELSPFYRVRKLLRSRTYLSWRRGHGGLFWERLRRALQSGPQLSADAPLPQ